MSTEEFVYTIVGQPRIFQWDVQKYRLNFQKHGVDFVDIPELFNKPFLVEQDQRKDYGEARWIALGVLKGQIFHVTFTYRGSSVRLISARKAHRHEKNIFNAAPRQDRLEPPQSDEG